MFQLTIWLRSIDRFADLSRFVGHLACHFIARPAGLSIDPLELLVRMLFVGYCYGIRKSSERRLCEECAPEPRLPLVLCRLGLDGEACRTTSTFSKNSAWPLPRLGDLLRKLFETVVRRCIGQKGWLRLVDGAVSLSMPASIAADANKQRSSAGSDDVDWEAVARTRARSAVRRIS